MNVEPINQTSQVGQSEQLKQGEVINLEEKNSNIVDLDKLFNQQVSGYDKERFPSYQTRLTRLKQLYQLINNNSDAIAKALNSDFGCRSGHETEIAEIIGSLSSIRYQISNLKSLMKPQKRRTSIWFLPASSQVELQPLGVIGVMAPWNYSVHLTIAPIAAALAAGNRVMAKMSELTPNTSTILKELINSAFSADILQIIDGGVEVSQAFSNLPFNHLLFTGSTSVGKHIAMAAAKNLTPVTLELSGKSPVIITPEYDIEEAAKRILWGKTFNAGQTCIAPDYVLVPKDKLIEFVRSSRKAANSLLPQGLDHDDYTSVINEQHFNRLSKLVDDAREHGAEIIELAETVAKDNKLAPTLIIEPTSECKIFHDEIFGPLLPVFTYENLDDALEQIDHHPDPLSMYIFSKHQAQVKYITQQVRSGSVLVNDTLLQYLQNDLPFGGVGNSGQGKYHGKEGFEAFSNKQSTMVQRGIGTFTGLKLLYSPNSTMSNLMKTLIRKWP